MKYGELTVIGEAGVNKHKKRLWECLCDCGEECVKVASAVRTGRVKSCGHLKSAGNRKTHGCSRANGKQTRAYTAWVNMKRRCTAKNLKQYKDYGGRGITFTETWVNFDNFIADMGEPEDGMTLDRIDNNLGYSKDNCRWVSRRQQALNTRKNRIVEFNGKRQTVKEWSDDLGLSYSALLARLNRGWPLDKAIASKKYRVDK